MAKLVYLLLAVVAAVSAAPEGRIVGGTPTSIEEFPYIVALAYTYPGPNIVVQRCVGCLISSWHVLTTGFCFTGAINDNMKIRAGSTNSLQGGTVVGVRDVIKHDGYVEEPRAHDIAVVFGEAPIALSSVIDILYLPPQNAFIADGQEVKIVSWGFEYVGGPQLEFLKTVNLNKLSLADCQAAYQGNGAVAIVDEVICAHAPGRGMCSGDSGAPMVIDQMVVGASSFYHDCSTDLPDVFTRIDRYTNWILEVAVAAPSTLVNNVNIRNRPVSL